jgi:hypothetical protein
MYDSACCWGGRHPAARLPTWNDYRDLIIATHQNLSAPLIWCWDNLNIHLAPELADFAAENSQWLRVYRLPASAPDLIRPRASGRCSSGPLANFAAAGLDGLVRVVKVAGRGA